MLPEWLFKYPTVGDMQTRPSGSQTKEFSQITIPLKEQIPI